MASHDFELYIVKNDLIQAHMNIQRYSMEKPCIMEILVFCFNQTTQEGYVKFSSIPAPQPPASTVGTVPTTHQIQRDTPANVRVGDFIC